MSYQVFRVQRGRALHIIHETMTRHSLSGVRLLCKPGEASFGDRARGVPTCTRCLAIDDPCGLSDAERSMLGTFATRPDGEAQIYGGQVVTSLHQKDLIDAKERLTRRGEILAQDWLVGAAPAADKLGVVHARDPLSRVARCNRAAIPAALDGLGGLDGMTVDRYARLRALEQRVTCVLCAVGRRV